MLLDKKKVEVVLLPFGGPFWARTRDLSLIILSVIYSLQLIIVKL
jgi:hypothetical protein